MKYSAICLFFFFILMSSHAYADSLKALQKCRSAVFDHKSDFETECAQYDDFKARAYKTDAEIVATLHEAIEIVTQHDSNEAFHYGMNIQQINAKTLNKLDRSDRDIDRQVEINSNKIKHFQKCRLNLLFLDSIQCGFFKKNDRLQSRLKKIKNKNKKYKALELQLISLYNLKIASTERQQVRQRRKKIDSLHIQLGKLRDRISKLKHQLSIELKHKIDQFSDSRMFFVSKHSQTPIADVNAYLVNRMVDLAETIEPMIENGYSAVINRKSKMAKKWFTRVDKMNIILANRMWAAKKELISEMDALNKLYARDDDVVQFESDFTLISQCKKVSYSGIVRYTNVALDDMKAVDVLATDFIRSYNNFHELYAYDQKKKNDICNRIKMIFDTEEFHKNIQPFS